MGIIGKLLSTKIEDFILNTVEKRFNYLCKGETYAAAGDDSPGIEGDRVYLADIDGQGRSVVIGTLSVSQGAEEGEKILYSRDAAGLPMAQIYLKKDGGIEIISKGDLLIKAEGTKNIRVENSLGFFELDGVTGQFNVNDQFTVDV